jgi:hypothetical protein
MGNPHLTHEKPRFFDRQIVHPLVYIGLKEWAGGMHCHKTIIYPSTSASYSTSNGLTPLGHS